MTEETGIDAAASPGGFGRRAAAGVLWMTVQKWVLRITGLVTVAVLTRMLRPEDFGLVAAASTVVPVIYLFADLGFATYLVQAETVDQRRLSTGFWFSSSAGVILCAAFAFSAPLIERVFHLDGLTPVLQAMTVPIVLIALSSIPVALLKRRLQFRLLSIQGMISAAIGQVVAVVAALSGLRVWALVLQLIVSQLIGAVLCWRSSRWRPSWQFSRSDFRLMAGFGLQVAATDGIAMLRGWGETAIVSVSLGVNGLGYLNVAQRLIQTVQDMSAAALLPVSTVVFAQVRSTTERLRHSYLRALAVSYAAVAPLLVVVTVAAPSIVPFLFGDQWTASVPVSRALAVAAIFTLGAMLDNGLFVGAGRPRAWLVYAAVTDGVTVATTAVAVRWGLTGVAVAFVGVAVLATVARWVLVARLLSTTTVVISRPFFLVSACAAVSGFAGWGVYMLVNGWPQLAAIVSVSVVVGVVHVAAVRVVLPGVAREVVRLLPVPETVAARLLRLMMLPAITQPDAAGPGPVEPAPADDLEARAGVAPEPTTA